MWWHSPCCRQWQERVSSCSALRELPRVWWRAPETGFSGCLRFRVSHVPFSTPDEIFGPVSISKLKDADTYERIVDGYLPSATIAFLDEIWKAGPAIQNALLTIINEKIYRNGQFSIRVPLKGLIAASNELLAQGQGLEALWDRFLLRCLVGGIEDMGEFDRMISSTDETEPVVDEQLQITGEEYVRWEKEIAAIKIHYSILK